MDFELATDRSLIRFTGGSRRYLRLRLTAPGAEATRPRSALDLALVLDRSGSMEGQKWQHAVAAAQQTLPHLEPRDRLALVVYDNEVDILLEPTAVTADIRRHAKAALKSVGPRGGTDLGRGWLTGCALIGEGEAGERLRRCFLLTDGQANTGITDVAELARHAVELRRRGVTTSTFGIGDDYDEGLLGPLAEAAGGAFHDIARAEQIGPVLSRELGEALAVVYREVTLTVRVPPRLEVEVLGPWSATRDDAGLTLQVGDLVSEQELDLLLRVDFPDGAPGATCGLDFQVTAEGHTVADGRQSWEWAEHAHHDRQPRQPDVARAVATYYAHAARRQAALDNRDGACEAAVERLRAVAARIRREAAGDPELEALAQQLEAEAEAHRERLSQRDLKARYYDSTSQMRGRQGTGERRRRS